MPSPGGMFPITGLGAAAALCERTRAVLLEKNYSNLKAQRPYITSLLCANTLGLLLLLLL